MKSYTILPVIAVFLIALSVGDEMWSLSYLIKTIPALVLIIISVILLAIEIKKKNRK